MAQYLLRFDGVDDAVDTNQHINIDFPSDGFYVEWKAANYRSSGAGAICAQCLSGATLSREFLLFSDNRRLRFFIGGQNTSTNYTLINDKVYRLEIDGNAATYTLLEDGNTVISSAAVNRGSSREPLATFTIGARNNGTVGSYTEFSPFDLYYLEIGSGSVIHDYDPSASNGIGTTLFDTTANANNGTLVNFTVPDCWVLIPSAGVTASSAITAKKPTVAAAAEVTLPAVVEASASVTAKKPTVLTSATATLPQPIANVAVLAKKPTVVASATASLLSPTASVSVTAKKPTVASSAAVTLPQPIANAAILAKKPTVQATGAATSLTPNASVSVTAKKPTASATASATLPDVIAAGDILVKKPTASASASATLPQPSADVSLTAKKPSVAGLITVGIPQPFAVGAVTAKKPTVNATGAATLPDVVASSAFTAKKPTVSAIGLIGGVTINPDGGILINIPRLSNTINVPRYSNMIEVKR